MERYKIKPTAEQNLKPIRFSEFYISPDMQFMSGVTDYNSELYDDEQVMVTNNLSNEYGENIFDKRVCSIKVENIRRQGKVAVTLSVPVKTITKNVSLPVIEENGEYFVYINQERQKVDEEKLDDLTYFTSVTQKYVKYNGNISYFFNGPNKGYIIDGKFYASNENDVFVEVEKVLFIEDGKLFVGDYEYTVVFNEDKTMTPIIKYGKYGEPIENGDKIGEIDGYVCKVIENGDFIYDFQPKNWKKVQKFTINNEELPNFEIEEVLLGAYKHFVEIEGERYWMKYVKNSENNETELGFIIDDVFYEPITPSISDSVYQYDMNFGSDAYITLNGDGITDESTFETVDILGNTELVRDTPQTLEIQSEAAVVSNNGNFIYLITVNDSLPLDEGSIIVLNASVGLDRKLEVYGLSSNTGENEDEQQPYIIFNGERYELQKHIFDTVDVNGHEYRIIYNDDLYKNGYIELPDGNRMEMTFNDNKATPLNSVYKLNEDGSKIVYTKTSYNMYENYGVIINGAAYKMENNSQIRVTPDTNDLYNIDDAYVMVYEDVTYELIVEEVLGSSTYKCIPVIDEESMTKNEAFILRSTICGDIVDNFDKFKYTIKKNTFGRKPLRPDNSLVESMSCMVPMSVKDRDELAKTTLISKISSNISLKLPLSTKVSHNLMGEDIVNNIYTDYMKSTFLNEIVDMEKDVYYPVYAISDPDKDDDCNPFIFNDIHEVRFNMHFRTRNLENWKPYDNTAISPDGSPMDNWFITDYKMYNNTCKPCDKDVYSAATHVQFTSASQGNFTVSGESLHNASDLIGFLNFTTSEVKNQAKKISNSFLRMSLYSTDDINTQVLLGTVCMYLDGQRLLKNIMSLQDTKVLKFADAVAYEQYFKPSDAFINNCGCDEGNQNMWKLGYPTVTSEVMGNRTLNDDLRLSSRITVKDKYNSESSAEGFYQYIYKEYSSKKNINTVYARFEFNHAGLGFSIPMMLPRAWDNNGNARLLYIHGDNGNDLKILKQGFSMKDIYKQLHVPINVKYDGKTNRYVYWLDESLRGRSDDILELSLFEIKFKDETFG